MANIQCACTGNKIRLKKNSPDKAMANASATIIGHQGTSLGGQWGQYNSNLIRPTMGTPNGGGKYSPQNMHPLQVVAKCTRVDQVRFCVTGLGLCTTIGFKLTSGAQLCH